MEARMLEGITQQLQSLSSDVHAQFEKNGLVPAATNCRTECGISIGPDGKPVYTCKLVCDW